MLLEGLRKLSSRFQGEIDLELFLIEGINTSLEDLKEYADFVKTLSYRKLQLNSLDRPGTEVWVKPVTYPRLLEIKKYLEEPMRTLPPIAFKTPPTEIVGSVLAASRICASIDVVVVLPCVPATAIGVS